jgi:hypothetical protein
MGLPGRYRIELYGEGAGIVAVVDSDDLLEVASILLMQMRIAAAIAVRAVAPDCIDRSPGL